MDSLREPLGDMQKINKSVHLGPLMRGQNREPLTKETYRPPKD